MKRLLSLILGCGFMIIGVLHFKHESRFRKIVPEYLPLRKSAVIISGVVEIIFGLLLIVNRPGQCLKKMINMFLLAVLPANIYMARKKLPLGDKQLPNSLLYSRIPLQFVIIKIVNKL
ncbi:MULTISPECIES: hypothetical protein [unclassified Staphylococcus]|uniref:DoxX family protein n=1 Tax=unclassified Staphylococcus TaxID=91994 RepID=UPI00194EBC3F|nr:MULTISPECIES: hypothetical protein [unclassified Staphylococcus]